MQSFDCVQEREKKNFSKKCGFLALATCWEITFIYISPAFCWRDNRQLCASHWFLVFTRTFLHECWTKAQKKKKKKTWRIFFETSPIHHIGGGSRNCLWLLERAPPMEGFPVSKNLFLVFCRSLREGHALPGGFLAGPVATE